MANKSKIITTPLVGDLNLSRNKLDVIAPGESGYLKNDGVIYGNVLSPIFQSNTGYDAEYYDKEGNIYNVGRNSLSKNGTSVMSYQNKKLTEEKLDAKNLLSYDDGDSVRTVDEVLYINDADFPFVKTEEGTTLWSIAAILTARSIKNVGALIMYIGTDGNYYLSFWNSDSGEKVREQLTWTEVNSPLITWYKKENGLYFISAFSDSGADFKGSTSPYALKIDNNTYTFKPIVFEPKVSQTETVTTSTSYEYKNFLSTKYPDTEIAQQAGPLPNMPFSIIKQNFSASFPYDWNNPCNIKIDFYWTSSVIKESYQGGRIFTYHGATYQDILDIDISNIDVSSAETENSFNENFFVLLPTLLGSLNQDSMTFKLGTIMHANDKASYSANVSGLVNVMDGSESVEGDPAHAWKKGQVPSLLVMDGNDNDKRAAGFIWAEISWTSNNQTQSMRVKVIPATNSLDSEAWRSGWDYVKLYKSNLPEEVTTAQRSYLTSSTTSTILDTPLVPLNAFLDGGKLICTALPQNTSDDSHFEKGLFGFTGAIDSVVEGDVFYTVKYNADGSNTFYLALVEDTSHAYPYSLISATISLDKNHFRYLMRTKGFGEATEEWQPDETDILFDSGFDKVIINPGHNSNTGTLKSGSVYQRGKFRILYNNNIISNVSYSQNENEIGTLLCDWDIIDEVLDIHQAASGTVLPDYIVIRDTYGNIIKYSWENSPDVMDYKVVLNRFIVVNTTSYYNCYDIKTDQKMHYASDYNNRFLMGVECYDYLKQGEQNDEMFSSNTLTESILGSNQNGNYQITNEPISSYSVAPEQVSNMWINSNPFMLKSETTQAIDIYAGFQNTVATYYTSFINGVFIRNTELDLAYMSTDTLYNPNIFTRYIETYSFNDMIINGKTNTAYPLNKYNGQMFLSYRLESGIENAENVFVVQTLIYYISADKIWEAYFDNGVLSNVSAVAAIKGLQYLGCLPTEAIFWSPLDRTFWSFGGDAILRKVIQANDISTIKGSWYNEGTQELFIGTDIGLLCLNNINNYLLRDFKDVSDMWFFDDYFIAKNTSSSVGESETDDWKIAYEPTVLDVDNSMHLETKWFGSTENFKSRFDCIYFRVSKPSDDVTPHFSIKITTMTDMGLEDETKTVPLEFDSLTDTAYFRVQPKFQTAVSMKFAINTNCPLISWSIGYTELQEVAQISQINI